MTLACAIKEFTTRLDRLRAQDSERKLVIDAAMKATTEHIEVVLDVARKDNEGLVVGKTTFSEDDIPAWRKTQEEALQKARTKLERALGEALAAYDSCGGKAKLLEAHSDLSTKDLFSLNGEPSPLPVPEEECNATNLSQFLGVPVAASQVDTVICEWGAHVKAWRRCARGGTPKFTTQQQAQYWKDLGTTGGAPVLSRMAIDALLRPPGSAAAERVFSHLTNMSSADRYHMSAELLRRLLFVRSNWRVVHQLVARNCDAIRTTQVLTAAAASAASRAEAVGRVMAAAFAAAARADAVDIDSEDELLISDDDGEAGYASTSSISATRTDVSVSAAGGAAYRAPRTASAAGGGVPGEPRTIAAVGGAGLSDSTAGSETADTLAPVVRVGSVEAVAAVAAAATGAPSAGDALPPPRLSTGRATTSLPSDDEDDDVVLPGRRPPPAAPVPAAPVPAAPVPAAPVPAAPAAAAPAAAAPAAAAPAAAAPAAPAAAAAVPVVSAAPVPVVPAAPVPAAAAAVPAASATSGAKRSAADANIGPAALVGSKPKIQRTLYGGLAAAAGRFAS